MKKYVLGFLSGLVILVVGFVLEWPDGRVHMVVCDVGQGDGILIWQGFFQAVIDGGPNEKMVECLSKYVPFWDRRIEMVMMTNGDADHMTGLISLFKRYKIDQMIANNLVRDTGRFGELRKEIMEEKVAVHAPQQGEVLRLRSGSSPSASSGPWLRFDILWPEERLGDKLVWTSQADERVLGANTYSQSKGNEQSVVVRLVYSDFSALLTGDIGSGTERVLINSGRALRSDILKVAHHGSKYSSASEFLRAVKPALAVISVGKNNYGHPTKEALERLKGVGAKIMRTDQDGDVEVVSDGEKVWVR